MEYLDLFTGIGGFSLAIQRQFPGAVCVGWSEINKTSSQTYLKNFPTHTGLNIGDIERFCFDIEEGRLMTNEKRIKMLPSFDLVTAGSPCQDLSIQRANRRGLAGTKSRLFHAFAEIIRIKKPKYFLLENVASMSRQDRDEITKVLGVEPVEINSDIFTPQKRRRLYWFNWDLDSKNLWDRGVRWDNLVAWSKSGRKPKADGSVLPNWKKNKNGNWFEEREVRDGRANTLLKGIGCAGQSSKNFIETDMGLRELTIQECEILQTFPKGWTEGVSRNKRFQQIGDSVTVRVIEEILGGIHGRKMGGRCR